MLITESSDGLLELLVHKESCVAPYVGARAFPADLNSHLTDSRLPSRAHKAGSTRGDCSIFQGAGTFCMCTCFEHKVLLKGR